MDFGSRRESADEGMTLYSDYVSHSASVAPGSLTIPRWVAGAAVSLLAVLLIVIILYATNVIGGKDDGVVVSPVLSP